MSHQAVRRGVLASPAEGWQSGRMRRSRKPFRAVTSDVGSNPTPSAGPLNDPAAAWPGRGGLDIDSRP